jgi:hypothetical protein
MYYVYALIDPRNGSPFYIGKGKGKRVDAHEIEARKGCASKKCARIREIWASDLAIVKAVLKRFHDEDAAYTYEKQRIDEIGVQNLTNATSGGRSPAWLVWDNTIRGDIDVLRVFASYQRMLPRYGKGTMFHEIYKAAGKLAAQVLRRRGCDWANSMVNRTGLIIESRA